MKDFAHNMGDEGRDKITGFIGIITGRVQYLTGCYQYLLSPKCKPKEADKRPAAEWFDEDRIEVTKKLLKMKVERKGFDKQAPLK